MDFNPASRSLSVSQTQRALLLPQEVINLPRDEQILLIESSPPIKSQKIKYYYRQIERDDFEKQHTKDEDRLGLVARRCGVVLVHQEDDVRLDGLAEAGGVDSGPGRARLVRDEAEA